MKQHTRPPISTQDTQAFRQISWVVLNYGPRHSLPYACRPGQPGRRAECVQSVQSVVVFRKSCTEPLGGVSAGGEPRRHSDQYRARQVPGKRSAPHSSPHMHPQGGGSQVRTNMQRVSEAFLGDLAVKDQTPSGEPAMQHQLDLDGDSRHSLGMPSCSWVRFDPFQPVVLP